MTETVIERVQGEKYCMVYTGERKFVNQLKSFPDIEVTDVGDGHVKAKVPYEWFRFVKPPVKRNISNEQKLAASKRLKKYHAEKNNSATSRE